MLARVIRNFLSNAVRYTEQGYLLLGCRRRPDGLEIMVGDTGPGMPELQQEAIFLEFRRAQPSHESHSRGLGLGLAIVDRISTILKHPILLKSLPGRGAIFSIRVPYGQLAQRSAQRAVEPTQVGQEAVEGCGGLGDRDDPAIFEGMQALLRGWECHGRTAASLGALEAASDGEEPAVLLVDYHLGEDGPTLALRLRRAGDGDHGKS